MALTVGFIGLGIMAEEARAHGVRYLDRLSPYPRMPPPPLNCCS